MKYSIYFLGLTSLSGHAIAARVPRSNDLNASPSSLSANNAANQAPKAKGPAHPVTLYRGGSKDEDDDDDDNNDDEIPKKIDCAVPGVWPCYSGCLEVDNGLDNVTKREACVDYCEEKRNSKQPEYCTTDPDPESDDEPRTRRTHHGRDTVARARAQREKREWTKKGKAHCMAKGRWPCYRNCMLISYENDSPLHSGACKKVCKQHEFDQPSDCTTTSDDWFGGVLDPQGPRNSKKLRRRVRVDSDGVASDDSWKATKRALNAVDKVKARRVEDE